MDRSQARATLSKLNYPREKFLSAVITLATSGAGLKQRLEWASLSIIAVKLDDFPEGPLRDRFARLKQKLSEKGPLYDWQGRIWLGAIANTLRRRRRTTLEPLAEEFVGIYFDCVSEMDHLEDVMRNTSA